MTFCARLVVILRGFRDTLEDVLATSERHTVATLTGGFYFQHAPSY